MKSDRGEKRELRKKLKLRLLPVLHTAEESLSEDRQIKVTEMIRLSLLCRVVCQALVPQYKLTSSSILTCYVHFHSTSSTFTTTESRQVSHFTFTSVRSSEEDWN